MVLWSDAGFVPIRFREEDPFLVRDQPKLIDDLLDFRSHKVATGASQRKEAPFSYTFMI
jgi:hypothetical protein